MSSIVDNQDAQSWLFPEKSVLPSLPVKTPAIDKADILISRLFKLSLDPAFFIFSSHTTLAAGSYFGVAKPKTC